MALLKSLFYGSEGSYNIFGIQVTFENDQSSNPTDRVLNGAGLVSKLVLKILKCDAFHHVTQSNLHVFMHEMGHALACKVFTGQNSEVRIIDKRGGYTRPPNLIEQVSDWKKTMMEMAGPMGDVTFSICKLVVATTFKSYVSWPVALFIGIGAAFWISGELLYAYVSALKKDNGDFGKIAQRGNTHLAFATVALISQCVLGIFAAIKLAA